MNSFNFKEEYYKSLELLNPNGVDWDLVGVLANTSEVYTLSYDSKILSGIFEILVEPIVQNIAERNNLILAKGVQNAYPEFTLYDENLPKSKIAVDVKSTYRKFKRDGSLTNFSFTLGSYKSYLRDGVKGIKFPYKEYAEHWIVGFLYTRNENCKNVQIKKIIEAANLEAPYTDIEFFVQEKYKIAGLTPGSGNTTNIGSIKRNSIKDFENGIFGFNSDEDFVKYWSEYEK
ncbi:MAG: type II restriction endonuclease [Allomuricauda sp.]